MDPMGSVIKLIKSTKIFQCQSRFLEKKYCYRARKNTFFFSHRNVRVPRRPRSCRHVVELLLGSKSPAEGRSPFQVDKNHWENTDQSMANHGNPWLHLLGKSMVPSKRKHQHHQQRRASGGVNFINFHPGVGLPTLAKLKNFLQSSSRPNSLRTGNARP